MRHRKSGRKLGRNTAHLRALFRNMTASLLTHGRIETTLARAKELRGWVEPVITRARRLRAMTRRAKTTAEQRERALAMRRRIATFLPRAATAPSPEGDRLLSRRDLVGMLVDEIAPKYATRPGGYTRIRRLGFRKGDNAPIVVLELVPAVAEADDKKKEPAEAEPKKKRSGFFRRGKAEAAAADEARKPEPRKASRKK